MQHHEHRAVLSLAAIMAFRMLGLFMILPVFAVQAHQFAHATPLLIGMALGIYGLTQALLQMPFGMWSDRIGRKPVIAIGLLLFGLGSVVAALSHSMTGIIIGRALQGAGAIGSTTLAMVADVTRDEQRSKAMAFIGLSIGFAFTLAMILGPIINSAWQLSGIFWVTSAMALIGLLLLYFTVPTPPKLVVHRHIETDPSKLKSILKNPQLLRLDFGIMTLHAVLTALFLAIPTLLVDTMKLTDGEQVLLYLVVLVVAFFAAVPLIIIAEKRRKMKPLFVGAIATLVLVTLLLARFHHHTSMIALLLLIFFTAFTLLEASLPSLVSKISPIQNKGTAMGVYSTSQFFGIFLGGTLGGVVLSHFGATGIFIFAAAATACWLLVAFTMSQPPYLSTIILPINQDVDQKSLQQTLAQVPGVAEVAFMFEEAMVYLKIDKKIISEHELRKRFEEGTLS